MNAHDIEQLFADIRTVLAEYPTAGFGILGHTPITYDLLAFFISTGAQSRIIGIYTADEPCTAHGIKPLELLRIDKPSVIIIASDEHKEELLLKAEPYLSPTTKVIFTGYGHFAHQNSALAKILSEALVSSLANGYPHTLTHLVQCLDNAARLGLLGIVVEFGAFKGGTTRILCKYIEHLGMPWKVFGFDTFAGFPAKKHLFDMYAHPWCVCHDEASVRNYLAGCNVELIAGDIVQTASRLGSKPVVLAFIDTDNYSSAVAAIDAVQNNVVPGGAIVFDHLTGRDRFRYTLGERIAAKRLFSDARYFNLHDTGVFLRQR